MDQLQLRSQHRHSGRPLAALISLLLFFTLGLAQAAEPVAKVVTLLGAVDVIRAETGAVEPVELRSLVYQDDTLRTDIGSRVKLLLTDDSLLKLGPETELTINRLTVAEQSRQTDISLHRGRVRSVVGERLSSASRYEIRTGVAIAGVRGTDWEVVEIPQDVADNGAPPSTPPSSTAVRTFEGLVNVRSSNPELPGEVNIGPNTFTLVRPNLPPIPPQAIPPGEDVGQRARQQGQGPDREGPDSEGPDQGPGERGPDAPPSPTPAAPPPPQFDPLDQIEGQQLPPEPMPPESQRPNGLMQTPPPVAPPPPPPPPPLPPPPKIIPTEGTFTAPITITIPPP